ncbi:Uncharacterised protein [Bordetella pertussis]|nr:Uncharacterised protein [Bordetella pertussis]
MWGAFRTPPCSRGRARRSRPRRSAPRRARTWSMRRARGSSPIPRSPARWRWTSCRASWRTTGAPRGPRSTMVSTGSSCMPPMATCWTSSCARAATIATTRTAARSRTGRGCCCGRSMRSAPRSAPIASASGSRRSRRPTMRTTTSRSPCSNTCCASWRGAAWRTCT